MKMQALTKSQEDHMMKLIKGGLPPATAMEEAKNYFHGDTQHTLQAEHAMEAGLAPHQWFTDEGIIKPEYREHFRQLKAKAAVRPVSSVASGQVPQPQRPAPQGVSKPINVGPAPESVTSFVGRHTR